MRHFQLAIARDTRDRIDGRKPLPSSVMQLDLDGFKGVNDTFGHDIADHYLVLVGEIVRRHLRRRPDFAGRRGGEAGDEIVAFLTGANISRARDIAERLRVRISGISMDDIAGWTPQTTSIGVAELKPNDTPGSILARVDQMTRYAKGLRNTVIAEGDRTDHLPPIRSLRT